VTPKGQTRDPNMLTAYKFSPDSDSERILKIGLIFDKVKAST